MKSGFCMQTHVQICTPHTHLHPVLGENHEDFMKEVALGATLGNSQTERVPAATEL